MAEPELVSLTIEGSQIRVPRGTTILEAAKQAGVLIPHYCYHPGLPVAGVCRMCLVEVEKQPKLQIACATAVAEGQVVNVFSDQSKKARQSVLEFLLINHPLDCPICDQAGECELQDYVFQEGRAHTRYTDYAKRFNPVEDFGPDILYVANRCILCTRCVRFMEHAAQEDVLNVSERGDRAVIGIHPDKTLDHPWSGNVVDLCPVGSLLSKDFLHRVRAWELDKTASVCPGCSQGCNVNLDTRNNVVVRLRPRTNLDVNRYFMCDHGRAQHRWLNVGDRIEAPLLGGRELTAVDWDHALDRVVQAIKGISGPVVAIVSPHMSNEALFLTRQVLSGLKVKAVFRVEREAEEFPLPGVPDLALRAERAPNAVGATIFGYREAFDATLPSVANAGLLLVLGDDLREVPPAALENPNIIYLGTHLPELARRASVVLPIANVAEEDGTFVNRDRRVQRYFQAKSAPGMARPAWWVLGEILHALGRGERLSSAPEAFDVLARSEPSFEGLSYEVLGARGVVLPAERTAGVSA